MSDERSDKELRDFIESWIPVNTKDAQHVKVAKLEAREQFVLLMDRKISQGRIDELRRLKSSVKLYGASEVRQKIFSVNGWGLIFKDGVSEWAASFISDIVNTSARLTNNKIDERINLLDSEVNL